MDKIYNFLQDVRKYPEIYLGQRSLTLLYPTLCGMIERLQPKEHCLIGFQEYIASRFQITTGQNWAKIIRFFSSDERHALEQFYGCFDDFIKTQIASASWTPAR